MGAALLVFGLTRAGAEDAVPASVRNRTAERALTTVTLTAEAQTRLGVETVAVVRRTVAHVRTLGGILLVPPGGAITVAAPLEGAVLPPSGGRLLAPGTRVARGEELLALRVLPPEDLRRAREIVAVAEARVAVAAARPGEPAAPGGRETGTDLAAARAALEAARARLAVLTGDATAPVGTSSAFAPLTVSSPDTGIVQGYLVGIGQTVPAAAPLIQLAALDPLWVRVPVYAGDAGLVRPRRSATIRPLGAGRGPGVRVVPVAAPPSADGSAATVDVFYVVPNEDGRFRPGERVAVTLPLAGAREYAVVPWSAVVHDVYGGTWVYVLAEPRVFVRRRIEVARMEGAEALVTRGLAVGEHVVSAGAAELYGTEFGVGE